MSRIGTCKAACGVLAGLLLLAAVPSVSAKGSDARFHFRVEIDGVVAGQFQEVEGLSIEQDVIEVRDSVPGGQEVIKKEPGPIKYGDVTLKRGYIGDDFFANWIRVSLDPASVVDRRDGMLVLVDRKGREVARWHFTKGWPSKWVGPTLDGSSNEVAVEQITLVFEEIRPD